MSDTPLRAHLGYWLRLVSNHVSQAFADRLATHDVTVAEWVVLRLLHEEGERAASRLAEDLGMTRGGVSKLTARLEARRLIVRAVDERDRRWQSLALAPEGRALVPELTALADANDTEAFGHLAPADRETLERLIHALAAHHRLTEIPVT